MWIDTHAHLYDFSDNEIKDLCTSAGSASLGAILSTATNLETSKKVITHCVNHPAIFGAVGISPFDCEDLPCDWKTILEQNLREHNVIGLGEIGLDTTNSRYPSFDKQLPVFERQLNIAKNAEKPVIIHSRGIEKNTAEICRKNGCKKAVFHCFTGDFDAAATILDYGYYISFSGILTFRNAAIRELLPKLPPERLMLETDTPYLAPVPFRGKTNTPLYMRYIGEEAASLLTMSPDVLQSYLKTNFNTLFNQCIQ
jgi:TatD DNase family protein